MKNPIHYMIMITVMVILAGCGATAKEITRMSRSERTGVFTEVMSEGPDPVDYADLVITASLKIPLAGYYFFESKASDYSFLVNIDGQAVLWQVEGRKHMLPEYVDGRTSRDPEAGEGVKYELKKKIRLSTGPHKIFFGIPDESCYTTANISVKSGRLYVSEFKPEYRYKTAPTRIPTFLKGIDNVHGIIKENAD